MKEIDKKELAEKDQNYPGTVKALNRIDALVDKVNEIIRVINKMKKK